MDCYHRLIAVAQWVAPTTAHDDDRYQMSLDNAKRRAALPKLGDRTPRTSTPLHLKPLPTQPTWCNYRGTATILLSLLVR
jgi:hypothetical protein